jgi:uncharacterized membrane protein (UPF0127 family)
MEGDELPRRLRGLPRRGDLVVAATAPARLLGLAGLAPGTLPSGAGLLLPRTRSVHTVGMRFALDLEWLDAGGAVVRVDRGVPPGRLRACRRARAVVEREAVAAVALRP